jgi:hypothetical protein
LQLDGQVGQQFGMIKEAQQKQEIDLGTVVAQKENRLFAQRGGINVTQCIS